jgi:glycosyltransferase involved in cell wall biosynthesis
MKILFLTRSLDSGEKQVRLVEMAQSLQKKGEEVTILTFSSCDELNEKNIADGIKVDSLNKKGRFDLFRFLFRLLRYVRKLKPDVVHGYLSASSIMALLCRFMLVFSGKKERIVWEIMSFGDNLQSQIKSSKLSHRLEKMLSRFPDLIVANTKREKDYYESNGFPKDKMIIIPNGVDINKFMPKPERKDVMCRIWGIEAEKIIVGMGARLTPSEDHVSFFKAAKILHDKYPEVLFVCVGGAIDDNYSKQLRSIVSQLEINDCIVWGGYCGDMPAAYSAFDVAVSSSKTYETSHVIGEAMACGVPCVATDVGDSSWIVGDAGDTVPSGDFKALADAIELFIVDKKKRIDLGEKARVRISENFSKELVTSRFLEAIGKSEIRA